MSNLSGLEIRSRITSSGLLELWLEEVQAPDPGPGEVLVRVEAAPINPSDLALLVGPADLATLTAGGTPERPTATAEVPKARLGSVKAPKRVVFKSSLPRTPVGKFDKKAMRAEFWAGKDRAVN